MDSKTRERVIEYRRLAAADAAAEAYELGLTAQETKEFLFEADSTAIWDAQQGRAYRKPTYIKRLDVTPPMYDELGFLSDEEYKRLTGKDRLK